MMIEKRCMNCAFGDMDADYYPCCNCQAYSEWASETESSTISIVCVDGTRAQFKNCKNVKRDEKWLSFLLISENDKQEVNININSLVTYIIKYDGGVTNGRETM